MKLQISFDLTDLDKALKIGAQVAQYADIIEVGTILIHTYGVKAVEQFKSSFSDKTILADTKIMDRGKDLAELFAKAGADWITVMAGATKNTIHATCIAAHKENSKVMLDLLDSSSVGQSALEAKNLGIDAILFHQPYDERDSLVFLDKWDLIKGNTTLPIMVSAAINRDNFGEIMSINPYGIIVGEAILNAENPIAETEFFAQFTSAKI